MKKGITLITPAHANPIALKRTIESVSGICDEIIVADLCMFKEDSIEMSKYCDEYNMKLICFPFNHLYYYGFSEILNMLAYRAKNNIVLYLNVGEVIDTRFPARVFDAVSDENECNAWYIDHETEKHRWWRCYDRRYLKWSGRIHEELVGDYKPYHKPIFTFADTDKDMDNPFKAWVANDVKEMVYWKQLMHIVDHPEDLGATNSGWLEFAKDQYKSMRERMQAKSYRLVAFEEGNMDMYFADLYNNPNLVDFPFESTSFIEFQGDPKFLNKK